MNEDKEKSPETIGLFRAFSIGRQKTKSSDIIPSTRKFKCNKRGKCMEFSLPSHRDPSIL